MSYNDDDDFQNFNDNEADDYRNEGDDDREWDEDEDEDEGNYIDPEWDDDLIDGVGFADPGGNSALRAETEDNPRNLPCPTCGEPNRLTPIDRQRGYQCDSCADRAERGLDY